MEQFPVKSDIVETGVKKNETQEKRQLTVTETFPPIETAEDKDTIEKALFDVFDDYR